jgi:hypothetical protein
MGFFSSKKKVYVNAQVQRLVEDALVPDAATTALSRAIFSENLGVTDALLYEALHGSYRKFDSYYRYGRKGPWNNGYYRGLPDAKVLTSSDGFELALAALEDTVGYPVTIEYMHFRPLNNIHAGWKHCVEQLGWDRETNELKVYSAFFGKPAYLDRMVAVTQSGAAYPEQSSQGQFGDSPAGGFTPVRPGLDSVYGLTNQVIEQEIRIGPGETESVEIWWGGLDENGDYQDAMTLVNLTSYNTDQEYYQAKYTYNNGAETKVGFWIYDPETGPYTELNNVFEPDGAYVPTGTYFPFATLRAFGQNKADDALVGTANFKSTEKLLEYLGIDFKQIADGIEDDPDGNGVESAVIMMAVPINSTNEVEIDYLHRYFDRLAGQLPVEATARTKTITELVSKSAAPDVSYAIQFSDIDFSMTFSFDKVTVRNVPMDLMLGPRGVTNTTETLDTMPAGTSTNNVDTYTVRIFRKQVVPGVVREVRVLNPQLRYQVRNKGADAGFDDDKCLIPLDWELCKQIPVLKKQTLYYRSLRLVFTARTVVKEEWYETGLFKAIMVVVAVVIAVYTGQWQVVTAAYAAWGVVGVVIVLLEMLVTGYVIGLAVTYAATVLVKLLGADLALALTIAVVAVAAYQGATASTVPTQRITAMQLLKVATSLTEGINTEVSRLMAEVGKDLEKQELYQEKKWAELDAAMEALDTGISLDPFTFIQRQPFTVFGESPSDYYTRVSNTNPGVESLNLVKNFVEISLRLPTTESIGE